MKRRIYYIPGLISIIGLPILLFFWGPKDPLQRHSLALRLPTDKKDPGNIILFSKEGFLSEIKNKKIVSIELNEEDPPGLDRLGDFRHNRKLHCVTQQIEQLQFTNDTNTVLKVGLGEYNTYGEFVWLCNHSLLYRIKRYAFIDNSFYFLAAPPIIHEPGEHYIESLYLSDDDVSETTPPTRWEIFNWWLKRQQSAATILIRQNYVLVTGFLLLILIPGILRLSGQNNTSAYSCK